MGFQGERTAELALALGIQEVRPVDLVTAYGTLANGGKAIGHTTILTIKDTDGKDVQPNRTCRRPASRSSARRPPSSSPTSSPATPTGTSTRSGASSRSPGTDGRRPGDAQDRHEQRRQGPQRLRLHRAADRGRSHGRGLRPRRRRVERQLGQQPTSPRRAIAALLDRRLDVRLAGLPQRGQREWPMTDFKRPADGLVRVKIDPWTGFLATSERNSPSTSGSSRAPNRRTRCPKNTCGIDVVANSTSSRSFEFVDDRPNRDWLRRAARGPGTVGGPDRTRTAYFYDGGFHPYGASWGVLVGRLLRATESLTVCFVVPTPDPDGVVPSFAVPTPAGSGPAPLPCPPASPVGIAFREPVARTIGATQRRAAATDAEPTPEPTPSPRRSRPRAHARADAGTQRRPPRRRRQPRDRGGPRPAGRRSTGRRRGPRSLVRRAGRTILGPLDWTVRAGERWVVLGPNGSGKTTLLSIVGLELWPTAGSVDVLGARYGRVDSRELRRRIGAAGSAVEGALRSDLTPITLVMTARHAATEPWWHVYTDDGPGSGARPARAARARRRRRPRVRDAVRR